MCGVCSVVGSECMPPPQTAAHPSTIYTHSPYMHACMHPLTRSNSWSTLRTRMASFRRPKPPRPSLPSRDDDPSSLGALPLLEAVAPNIVLLQCTQGGRGRGEQGEDNVLPPPSRAPCLHPAPARGRCCCCCCLPPLLAGRRKAAAAVVVGVGEEEEEGEERVAVPMQRPSSTC